jgi:hypothetical protein
MSSLAERLDMRQAVGLYRRAYPLFQAAFEALGFPAARSTIGLSGSSITCWPRPSRPPGAGAPAELPRPPLQPGRGCSTNSFDPQLEALSSGQKLMVRVGPDNERRLKARLRELRARPRRT